MTLMKNLRSAAELLKTAFGPDYYPDREEITFLKGQLSEVGDELRRNPGKAVEMLKGSRSVDGALRAAREFLSDDGGDDDDGSRGSVYGGTIEECEERGADEGERDGEGDLLDLYRRKLASRLDEIGGMVEAATEGRLEKEKVAAAAERLVRIVEASDDSIGTPAAADAAERGASGPAGTPGPVIASGPANPPESAGTSVPAAPAPSETTPDDDGRPSWESTFTPSWGSESSATGATPPPAPAASISTPAASLFSTAASPSGVEEGANRGGEPVVRRSSDPRSGGGPALRRPRDPKEYRRRMTENRIEGMMGRFVTASSVFSAMASLVRIEAPEALGAVHVTCVDETEWSSRVRFARSLVARRLPALPDGSHSPLVVSTPGGTYPTGLLDLAEDHFAVSDSNLLVVLIQTHVGLIEPEGAESLTRREAGRGDRFGSLERYGIASHACGALTAVLEGRKEDEFIEDVLEIWSAGEIEALKAEPEDTRLLLMAEGHLEKQIARVEEEYRSWTDDRRGRTGILLAGLININCRESSGIVKLKRMGILARE